MEFNNLKLKLVDLLEHGKEQEFRNELKKLDGLTACKVLLLIMSMDNTITCLESLKIVDVLVLT